jgi:hypothetical protein
VTLGLACSGDEEDTAPSATQPTATSTTVFTPTASASSTPLSQVSELDQFRDFAGLFAASLLARDADFLLDRALEVETVCRGDEQLGQCQGHPAGETFRGIPGSAYQSDAHHLFTPEEYRATLDRYYGAAVSPGSDEFGDSSLQLYALASQEGANGPEFLAITTSMVDTYPTGDPIGATEREAHVFRFRHESGDWRFVGETVAVVSVSADDWLSGNCQECYDYWQRWTS